MTLCSYGNKLTREELAQATTPAATATHKPIPHIAVVEKLIEALGFRMVRYIQRQVDYFRSAVIRQLTALILLDWEQKVPVYAQRDCCAAV